MLNDSLLSCLLWQVFGFEQSSERFFERPDVQQRLARLLDRRVAAGAPSQVVALVGMGGAGKTQLARRYFANAMEAEANQGATTNNPNPSRFKAWFRADSKANLVQCYRELGARAGQLDGKESQEK